MGKSFRKRPMVWGLGTGRWEKQLTRNLDFFDNLVGAVIDGNIDRDGFSMVVNLKQERFPSQG
jgi:hypothetical protein